MQPISGILGHIVQHNLTYSLNNNALWWTMATSMGYFRPVHDHVVEGKGVHQNCLLYTLFIKWTIELSGIGHHLFPIWVASASMTVILSCCVQPYWEVLWVFVPGKLLAGSKNHPKLSEVNLNCDDIFIMFKASTQQGAGRPICWGFV